MKWEVFMEKIIDATLGLIEAFVIGAAIGFGGMKAIEVMHSKVQRETIEALKKRPPSLSQTHRLSIADARQGKPAESYGAT